MLCLLYTSSPFSLTGFVERKHRRQVFPNLPARAGKDVQGIHRISDGKICSCDATASLTARHFVQACNILPAEDSRAGQTC